MRRIPTPLPVDRAPRTTFSALLLALSSLAWLAAAGLAQAADDTTPTTAVAKSRQKVIEVDLTKSSLEGLPFDRPILLQGALPPDLASKLPSGEAAEAELRYYQSRKPLTLPAAKRDDQGRRIGPEVCQSDWRPVGPKGTEPGDLHFTDLSGEVKDGKFLFRVPGVRPNRSLFFCFSFQSAVSEELLTDFRETVAPLFDSVIAGTNPPGSDPSEVVGEFTEREAVEIRDALKAGLRAELPSADLRFAEGSFLDEKLPPAEVERHFADSFNPVWMAQLNLEARLRGTPPNPDLPNLPREKGLEEIQEGDGSTAGLRSILESLVQVESLQKLVKALSVARRRTGADALDEELRAYDRVLGWISSGEAPVLLTPDQLEIDSFRAMDGSTATELAAKLAGVRAGLEKLKALVEAVQDGGEIGAIRVVAPTESAPAITFAGAVEESTLENVRILLDEVPDTATGEALPGIGRAERLADNMADKMADAAEELRLRDAAFSAMLKEEIRLIREVTFLLDADSVVADTNQGAYFSVDTGLVAFPVLEEVVPYTGVNFYLRPINPPSITPLGRSLSRRLAFTFGLTAEGVDHSRTINGQQVKTIDNLFGNQSLMLGAGLRLNRMIRVGAGALLFRKRETLFDQDLSLTTTYYFSLSFDLDVKSAISGASGRLFNGGNGSRDTPAEPR